MKDSVNTIDGSVYFGFFYATINSTSDSINLDVRDYVNLGCPSTLSMLSEADKSKVCPSFSIMYWAFFIVKLPSPIKYPLIVFGDQAPLILFDTLCYFGILDPLERLKRPTSKEYRNQRVDD